MPIPNSTTGGVSELLDTLNAIELPDAPKLTTPVNDVKSVSNFYDNKSIARSYNFSIWLNFEKYASSGFKWKYGSKSLFYYLGKIKEHHMVGVDFPMNTFERESVNFGTMQYSIPLLSKQQALDIKITFEEDNRGNVAGLIQSLQNTVHNNGVSAPPLKSILGDIEVYVLDSQGQSISNYIAKDVFFLGASSINLTYSSNDAITYELTFGTNYIQYPEVRDLQAIRNPPFSIGLNSLK